MPKFMRQLSLGFHTTGKLGKWIKSALSKYIPDTNAFTKRFA